MGSRQWAVADGSTENANKLLSRSSGLAGGNELGCRSYKLTAAFPKEETYGLTAQIRRSGSSLPANIAEGYGRESTGAYVQHLRIAQGSLKEFETHLLLAERVGVAGMGALAPLLEKSEVIGKMLRSLIRSLEKSDVR